MKRWLVVAAAVALAAAAFAVLVRQAGTGGAPQDEIDDASRAKLEAVLREEGER